MSSSIYGLPQNSRIAGQGRALVQVGPRLCDCQLRGPSLYPHMRSPCTTQPSPIADRCTEAGAVHSALVGSWGTKTCRFPATSPSLAQHPRRASPFRLGSRRRLGPPASHSKRRGRAKSPACLRQRRGAFQSVDGNEDGKMVSFWPWGVRCTSPRPLAAVLTYSSRRRRTPPPPRSRGRCRPSPPRSRRRKRSSKRSDRAPGESKSYPRSISASPTSYTQ